MLGTACPSSIKLTLCTSWMHAWGVGGGGGELEGGGLQLSCHYLYWLPVLVFWNNVKILRDNSEWGRPLKQLQFYSLEGFTLASLTDKQGWKCGYDNCLSSVFTRDNSGFLQVAGRLSVYIQKNIVCCRSKWSLSQYSFNLGQFWISFVS